MLLAGSMHPFDLLGGTGLQAIVVGTQGIVRSTAGLVDYLGGVRSPQALTVPDMT